MSSVFYIDPEKYGLARCPYDRNHLVKPTKMTIHLLRCRPRQGYAVCPWNVFHVFEAGQPHTCEATALLEKMKVPPPPPQSPPSHLQSLPPSSPPQSSPPPSPPPASPPSPPPSPLWPLTINKGRGRGRRWIPPASTSPPSPPPSPLWPLTINKGRGRGGRGRVEPAAVERRPGRIL